MKRKLSDYIITIHLQYTFVIKLPNSMSIFLVHLNNLPQWNEKSQ
jgi:hypothetical protein